MKLQKYPQTYSLIIQPITGCPFQLLIFGWGLSICPSFSLYSLSLSILIQYAHKHHTHQSELDSFDLSLSFSPFCSFAPVQQIERSLSCKYKGPRAHLSFSVFYYSHSLFFSLYQKKKRFRIVFPRKPFLLLKLQPFTSANRNHSLSSFFFFAL